MATTSATPVKSREIAEIERVGLGYTEVAQYDLGNVDLKRRVQVRELAHYMRKETVEQFAVHMASSQFPPIVMTRDGYIVDGNTRVQAKRLRKENFFPAIVLDVDWEGGSPKRRGELLALAATLNQFGGERLTTKEVRRVARDFIALGWLNEQIGRAIGVRASTVTAVRKEVEAEAKLEKVGLKANGDDSVRGPSLRALGAKDVLALNDVPFRQLAELARDADLNAKEIVSLAKEAKDLGSDAAALGKLQETRAEMGDRIQERHLTGHGKPPKPARLRQFLGNVLKFEGQEQDLIETDPGNNAKHVDTLERSIAILSKVLGMQRGPSA